MDIRLVAVGNDALSGPDYILDTDLRKAHRLSRLFCNLMCRRYVVSGPTELDQIAHLLGVDVSPLYHMADHCDDARIADMLAHATSPEARKEVDMEITHDRERLAGNLERALVLVHTVVDGLATVADLPGRLHDQGFDTLDNKSYFADVAATFKLGSPRPSFGQDLRSLSHCLEYARSKGVTSVGFQFT